MRQAKSGIKRGHRPHAIVTIQISPPSRERKKYFIEKKILPRARKSFPTPPGGLLRSRATTAECLFGESVRRFTQAPCEFFHDAHGDLGISFNRRFEVPQWHHQGLRARFRRDHGGGP